MADSTQNDSPSHEPKSTQQQLLLALDMGGTSVKAALVTRGGEIIAQNSSVLDRAKGDTAPQNLIQKLVKTGTDLIDGLDSGSGSGDNDGSARRSSRVAAVGVCTCAAIKDREAGILAGAANLDGKWEDVALKDEIERLLREHAETDSVSAQQLTNFASVVEFYEIKSTGSRVLCDTVPALTPGHLWYSLV